MEQTINLNEMTIEELKIAGFDKFMQRETYINAVNQLNRINNDIGMINQEIQQRIQHPNLPVQQ